MNARTVQDAFLLPRISEMSDSMGNSTVYSTLDLAEGYHQMQMYPPDVEKTAFSVLGAHYEYPKLPFGLVNASASFQRLTQSTMSDFIPEILLVYLDDILIYAKNLEEHLQRLDKVLQRLRELGLKINS